MGLVGLCLGVADAPLDDCLVDGVGFGGFLGHQAHPDEQSFDSSKHRFSFLRLTYFFGGSSSSSRIFFLRINLSCVSSCFSSEAATTVVPRLLTASKTLAS